MLTSVPIDREDHLELSTGEVREGARSTVESAEAALVIFEQDRPDDRRPRAAIVAVWSCADGARRGAPAYAVELAAADGSVGDWWIEVASRATPVRRGVLHRCPPAPAGKSRVAGLMKRLDIALRSPGARAAMAFVWAWSSRDTERPPTTADDRRTTAERPPTTGGLPFPLSTCY